MTAAKDRPRNVGFWLGPILAGVIWAIPLGEALSPGAHRLAGLTVWMATWWMSEAVPVAVTALLPLALFPLLQIQGAKDTATAYGHDLVWLFFGGFQLAFAIERWGLHRRIASAIVRVIGTREDRLVLGFMLACGLLSMWLLNTSTTLMLLPVALAVARAIEGAEAGPFSAALLLGLAYAASVGGMGTYLGTAPNVVFAGVADQFGVTISFMDWFIFAAPLSVLLILVIWLFLTRVAFPVGRVDLPPEHPAVQALGAERLPWSPGEKRVAVIFLLAVTAWLTNRWILAALGFEKSYVTDTTIALAAAITLYIVPVPTPEGRRPILTWTESLRTPWHILLLFGGGFALASGFQETGLSAAMGQGLASVVDGMPLPLVILGVVLLVTFLTEVTSNTATATVLLPVIGGLAVQMKIAPELLMLPATLAASCAFMLPVATPPNAIVYASERFSLRDMSRAGLWINLGAALIITGWMLTWGQWVLP